MLEWLFGKKKQEPQPEVREQKKKKKLSQAQQQTEDRWQYQFLVQFLNSPLWRVSILDFVDHNCVVFDNEEENKFQYTTIHNKFKELVGTLFDGMMRQIGLDDQKLVSLLQKGFQSKQKKLFNQLLLCDDFLKFKELMVKRNRTLENQALKAMNGEERRASTLDKQRSVVYSSLKQSEQIKKKLEQEQEQILRKVLQMSRIEAQEKKQIQKLVEKVDKEEDYKKIREEEQRRQIQRQRQRQNQRREEQAKKEKLLRLQQARQKQKQKQQEQQKQKRQEQQLRIQNQKKSKMSKTKPLQPIISPATKTLSDLPPIKGISKKQTSPTQAQVELPSPQKPPQQQQKQELKTQSAQQRKKRLLEQREKIRKKKEEERKKMLEQEQSQNKKVMNIVLQDQGIHDSVHPQQQEKEGDEKVSKDEIQRRKEIMKKIKNRIVDDF